MAITLTRQPTDRSPDPRAIAARSSRRSSALLVAATGFGIVHHVDHVVRANHSGFPFTPELNLFTVSLAAYPLIFASHAPRRWLPAVAPIPLAVLFVAVLAGHTLFELPGDQHGPWVDGSNLAHVHSSAVGGGAVAVANVLAALLLAGVVSLIADARRSNRADS